MLSRKIHPDEPENRGLDQESMEYLSAHFEVNYAKFKQDLADIQSGKIGTLDAVRKLLVEYWFSLYADGQSKDEVPKLKQTRLYAMGNELWGTIYDVYGMDVLYETLNHPENFVGKFNSALCTLGKEEYLIK